MHVTCRHFRIRYVVIHYVILHVNKKLKRLRKQRIAPLTVWAYFNLQTHVMKMSVAMHAVKCNIFYIAGAYQQLTATMFNLIDFP